MWKRSITAVVATLLSLWGGGCSRGRLPEWKALPLGLLGSWDRSSSVVVGRLQNVQYVGRQRIASPPWPSLPANVQIYWCRADLVVYSTIKGKTPDARKKLIWGGAKPDCDLTEYGRGTTNRTGPLTLIWFVREESDYLRPVVDALGVYFFAFGVAWDDQWNRDGAHQFGRLLLTPTAVGTDLSDYARRFNFELTSTACFVLGREECVSRIRELAKLGDAQLSREACAFLRSQFRDNCSP